MELRDYVAIGSLLLSIAAFAVAILSNTKRYELRLQKRKEILDWYGKTVLILKGLESKANAKETKVAEQRAALVELSSQIEIGRFLFPNIIKGDSFGSEKPAAYRGYRNLILDLLVFFYRMIEDQSYLSHHGHSEILIKNFTSLVFEVLDPRSHLKETKKVTSRSFTRELTYEDFMAESPEVIYQYI